MALGANILIEKQVWILRGCSAGGYLPRHLVVQIFPKFCYIYVVMKKAVILLAILFFSATFCFADETPSPAPDSSMRSSETSWPRAAFFLHAGLFDAGLGAKVRFSQENGIYMTVDLRYQIFKYEYIRIPALFYFGGNSAHFVVGFTILNAVNVSEGVSGELAGGLNFDISEDWGVDILAFSPVGGDTGPSVLLDIRYVF